jgi:hypothetical protein
MAFTRQRRPDPNNAASDMFEDGRWRRAASETEVIASGAVYALARAIGIDGDTAPGWTKEKWLAELAPFAPVLAAMVTATAERYAELRRQI